MPRTSVLAEAGEFLRRHLRLVPLLLLMPLAGTVVHESAHAGAAMLQGARITRMEVAPWQTGGRHWGRVYYDFGAQEHACPACTSLAPYVLWALVNAAVAAVALLRPPRTREWSALFVVGYALTPLDLAQHVASWWLLGSTTNDLHDAFGPPSALPLAILLAWGVAVAVAGWSVQRRVYVERALSAPAYALLALMTAAATPPASWGMMRLLAWAMA
jgi:hypothetical protein